MQWKSVRQDAPAFLWDEATLTKAEWRYLADAGLAAGAAKRLETSRQGELVVSSLTADALATLELEGEVVPRDRMETCIRHHLGLPAEASLPVFTTHENCTAEVMVRVLQRSAAPPTLDAMNEFGERLSRPELSREPPSPLQPSPSYRDKRSELAGFVRWYGIMSRDESEPSPLLKAGLAHLWFESIHPFRRGSGIVGRALAEKVLLLRTPGMFYTPLAPVLQRRRNEYFSLLDRACKDRDATEWLLWFSAAAIEAMHEQHALISFINERTRLLDNLRDHITRRQEALLLHLFERVLEGRGHRISVAAHAERAGVDNAAAAADLDNLVAHGALKRKGGSEKGRYCLAAPPEPVRRVETADIV